MIQTFRLRLWVARAMPLGILQNAAATTGAALTAAGLGYVFWWLAARAFPPDALGFAAAAISAMTLLGTIGVLGLGTLMIAEVNRYRDRAGSLVAAAMTCAGLAGAVLGVGFAALSPLVSPNLSGLAEPLPLAMFGLGTGLTAAAIVLDQALVGLLRGGLQLGRNALFSVSRLIGLAVAWILLRDAGGIAIIATWVAASLVATAPLRQLFSDGVGMPLRPAQVSWPTLRRRGGDALAHHVLNIALQLPALALPVLVTVVLSATDNAYFYVAWMLAGVAFLGSSALTLALYAVAVREPTQLTRYTRFTLAVGLGCGVIATMLVFGVGYPLLGALFGPTYPDRAGPVLRTLIAAAVPLVIIDHYVALCRIEGRALFAARLVIPGSAVQLVIAALAARSGGLPELSLGWVAGVTLEAALMVPLVYRVAAPQRTRVKGGIEARGHQQPST